MPILNFNNFLQIRPEITIFQAEIEKYFVEPHANFDLSKIDLYKFGTEFQVAVWSEISKIQISKVVTYKELACKIGKPKAYRAVATACSRNQFPIAIPCHRVIRSDSKIGEYIFGTEAKVALLKLDGYLM